MASTSNTTTTTTTTTLSTTESQRAIAILEDVLEKLSFLSAITPDVLSHREEVNALVGDEISRIIAEQRALETKYDALIEQRAGLKGLANKSKLKEVQAQVAEVSYQLRESLKTLCRSLKDNPDVGDNLARIGEERDSLALLLSRTIHELRDSSSSSSTSTSVSGGHYRSLADFVKKETEQREMMAAVASREEATTKEVEALAATLKEEEDRHAYEVEVKRAEIGTLKDRLRKLKVDTMMTLRYARKEVSAKNEALGKFNAFGETDISVEVEELKQRLAEENSAHEIAMELLKKEQEEFVRKIEEWKVKHATDLAAKNEEIRIMTEKKEAQSITLGALQDRYEEDLQIMVDKIVSNVVYCIIGVVS
jgi:hypothetical protein